MKRHLVLLALLAGAMPAARAQRITEYQLPTAGGQPSRITPGPGGMWFAEAAANRVGLITAEGRITEFPVSRPAWSIVAGPDGNLWYVSGGYLVRLSPQGAVTEFPVPVNAYDLTVGPDGNLWFTGLEPVRGNLLCRATTDGQITTLPLDSAGASSIVAGPDGNLWLAYWDEMFNDHAIFRVTLDGAVTPFTLYGPPGGLAVGPDGNLWVPLAGERHIAQITPAGVTRLLPASAGFGMAAGPDGNLWFGTYENRIGRMTPQGAFIAFPLADPQARVSGVASGPDGSLWFTERYSDRIGRVSLDEAAPGLALLDGRFRAELAWSSATGSGLAHSVALSANAGYFWFDGPDDPEVVVKLLDWCPDGVLFFAAGLTSFGTALTLVDTQTGASRSWASREGAAFPPIQEHLGACPPRPATARAAAR